MCHTFKERMTVYLAADHRGFALKESLKGLLSADGFTVHDCGAHAFDPGDDYPDFAKAAGERVVADSENRGIFICGSGAGMAIAANRSSGIRAVTAQSVLEVQVARRDEDANVLCLGADFVDEALAKAIARAFIATPASSDPRHVRRRAKLGS